MIGFIELLLELLIELVSLSLAVAGFNLLLGFRQPTSKLINIDLFQLLVAFLLSLHDSLRALRQLLQLNFFTNCHATALGLGLTALDRVHSYTSIFLRFAWLQLRS